MPSDCSGRVRRIRRRGWLHAVPGGRRCRPLQRLRPRGTCFVAGETMHDLACRSPGPGCRFPLRLSTDRRFRGSGDNSDRVDDLGEPVLGRRSISCAARPSSAKPRLSGCDSAALLAACAAASRRDVSGLALLAAPNSGKAYVRELQALAHLLVAPDARASSFDGLEVSPAFAWRAKPFTILRDSIGRRRRSLPRRACCSCTRTIRLQSRSRKLNAFEAIEEAPFEAYARMMCDPTASVVPAKRLRS